MPIGAAGARLGNNNPLEFAKKGGHAKKSVMASLNLTSMVDMFTILVVFLMMTFSASGDILFQTKDITLPQAINYHDLERAPVVGISADNILLNGEFMARTEDVSQSKSLDMSATLYLLKDKLGQLKDKWVEIHSAAGEQWNGLVIIQADQSIDFNTLKKVMFTCGIAGYQNINFAVRAKAKGGAPSPG
jgi:biopolymer transport protein ExbD